MAGRPGADAARGLSWRERTRVAVAVMRGQVPMRRSLFDGARVDRLTLDWVTSRLAADDELRWTIAQLRSRARDLERNNPLAKQFLRILAVNVIGSRGPTLESRVTNNNGELSEPINSKIELAWKRWGRSPVTVDRRTPLAQFMRQQIKATARDGETFTRMWRGFPGNPFAIALEAVDPLMVDETLNFARGSGGAFGQNEIRMGIEVDEHGGPVGYWMWDRPPMLVAAGLPRKHIRVPADEMLHLYDPDRMNQTRGPSWFAPVMLGIKHMGAYLEAELVAARLAASKMGFFERKEGQGLGSLGQDDQGQLTLEANPGTFGILPDGYTLNTFDPNHPNTAFQSFVKGYIREIAVGLGTNYNSLNSDLEGVNFSSMRSGLLSERDWWSCVQDWFIGQFMQPLYREWMRMAMLSGELVLDSRDFRRFLECEWTPRGWPWVDPLKDVQAGVLAVAVGLDSRTAILAAHGKNPEQVFQQLKEEKEMAAALGIDITGPDTVKAPLKPGESEADAGDGAGDSKD